MPSYKTSVKYHRNILNTIQRDENSNKGRLLKANLEFAFPFLSKNSFVRGEVNFR